LLSLRVLYPDPFDPDLFQIAINPKGGLSPNTNKNEFDLYDESKFSKIYNNLESGCADLDVVAWITHLSKNKYLPLVFKIKPEDLFEGSYFKRTIRIDGLSSPTEINFDYLAWYEKYQSMVKERYFVRKMNDEEFEKISQEARKLKKDFCSKKAKKITNEIL
jgi:hypothetical protein